jgi:hypothetical protein
VPHVKSSQRHEAEGNMRGTDKIEVLQSGAIKEVAPMIG